MTSASLKPRFIFIILVAEGDIVTDTAALSAVFGSATAAGA
jgi:hypothetical protein